MTPSGTALVDDRNSIPPNVHPPEKDSDGHEFLDPDFEEIFTDRLTASSVTVPRSGTDHNLRVISNEIHGGGRRNQAPHAQQVRVDSVLWIIERLLAEGYRNEVERIGSKKLENSLRRPQAKFARKRLTDKSWIEVKLKVIEWMKYVERETVMAARFRRCSKYIKDWVRDNWSAYDNPNDPFPSETLGLADWLLLPRIRQILDVPNHHRLSKETIASSLGDDLYKLAHDWYRTCQGTLLSKLREVGEQPDYRLADVEKLDTLRLAVYTFSCTSCHLQFMSFRKALIHRCRPVDCTHPAPSLDYEALVASYLDKKQPVEQASWDSDLIRVNTGMVPHKAGALIKALGFDPDVATHDQLETCVTRLTCCDCEDVLKFKRGRKGPLSYEVFNWIRALYHQDDEPHCNSKEPCRWTALPMEVADRVRAFEDKWKNVDSLIACDTRKLKQYECTVQDCGKRFMRSEPQALLLHLRSQHGVLNMDDTIAGTAYEEKEEDLNTDELQFVYVSYATGKKCGEIKITLGE